MMTPAPLKTRNNTTRQDLRWDNNPDNYESYKKKFKAISLQTGIPKYLFHLEFYEKYFQDPNYIYTAECTNRCHVSGDQIANDIQWIYGTLMSTIDNTEIPELLQYEDDGVLAWNALCYKHGFERNNT